MKAIRRHIVMAAAFVLAVAFTATVARGADPLPSWNDGPSKKAIVEFVTKVTKQGSPDFVPPAERMATFDNDGKPVGINQHIGRRPIAAFGNSDGDLQMLQWTAAGSGARFCLYVHHTDADREYAYDRKDPMAKLDKGLDEAAQRGWTVVDMKKDWKTIYPPATK
jgi:hypothetical protein